MPITGKDLSLYFHVPFCKKKCPYCNFYSLSYKKEIEDIFLKSIKIHLEKYKSLIRKSNVTSIYFGGGTPSLLSIDSLDQIFYFLSFIDLKNIEITIELNPEDISLEKFKIFKKLNINRVSIGAQSFDNNLLKTLGRRHLFEDTKKAIFLSKEVGIYNISLDIMFDILNQSLTSFEKTLKELENLDVKHISLYNLTFEKGTFFYNKKDQLSKLLPSEKTSLDMLTLACKRLELLGFNRYEISAFCKKGFESEHNLGYWTGRDYLGFGPSAYSYFNKKRFKNISDLKRYFDFLKKNKSDFMDFNFSDEIENNFYKDTKNNSYLESKNSFIDYMEELKYPNNVCELLAIRLRVLKKINISKFEKEIGKIPDKTLDILKKSKLVNFKKNEVILNDKGLLYYDFLASEIV